MSGARARWIGLALSFVLAGLCGLLRARVALADTAFAAGPPEGLLKSDPGLLVYIVQRIVESGGSAPSDFRRDPRIEWPDGYDIPGHLPVGQEFALAWAYRAHQSMGGSLPLPVFCLIVSGAFASLIVVGVYLLALELSGSVLLALLSAALAAALPANCRTLGWVLMDEDFSLPFLVLHFALLARAWRLRTRGSIAFAALALGGAIATWHAASFLAAIEAACLLAWTLRTGQNPMSARGAWIFPLVLVAFATLVPFLRTTLLIGSVPMLIVFALWIAAWIEARRAEQRVFARVGRATLLLATLVALGLASFALSRALGGGQGEYAHVFELAWAKIRHLGALPDDPNELSMDARIMWQSSFSTLDTSWAAGQLALALVLIAPAVFAVGIGWRRPLEDPRVVIVATLTCLALPVAWLVSRTIVLPALLLPSLAAPFALYVTSARWRAPALALAVIAQCALFESYLRTYENPWYRPEQRQAEIAALVRAIPTLVPEGEAIACDSMNASAILVQTRRPIAIQPKWESRSSRERFEQFVWSFFHDDVSTFARLLREKYRCRYLLVDRYTLGSLCRYSAGLAPSDTSTTPGTAADLLQRQDEKTLNSLPGYRLLYRSPRTIIGANGKPTDWFRLFELEP